MANADSSSQYEELLTRLETLIALNLRLMHHLGGKDSKKEIGNDAVFLRAFGLKNPVIATILGSTPGSVAELISKNHRPKKVKASNGRPKRAPKNK